MHAHRGIQAAAKAVLAALAETLGPADTEQIIATRAVQLLAQQGITETWYYDCPAFVLLGSRSTLSISGRHYEPHDERVGDFNLVTIDLSPLRDGLWGDCARSFCIEGGRYTAVPADPGFRLGLQMERELHEAMRALVTPDTTFAILHELANRMIEQGGFENLDFAGNLGHSIASHRDERSYIEAGNTQRLGDAALFTFEPHIRASGSPWGFKHENIYFFEPGGRLQEL